MSDWNPEAEEGGTIWFSGKVQALIDEARAPGESPNQTLERVLGDGTYELEILDREEVREIAWDVVEEAKHQR